VSTRPLFGGEWPGDEANAIGVSSHYTMDQYVGCADTVIMLDKLYSHLVGYLLDS